MTTFKYPQFRQLTQTPVSVLIANEYLNRLDYAEYIDSHVDWDKSRSGISPGTLAKAVVLSTFYEVRSPLYKIANRFNNSDTEFIFGSGITANHLNDDAIAACLDKIAAAGSDKLFSGLSLCAYTKYNLDLSRLHSDTSNIVMYGDYEMCDEDNYEGLVITHGHSKANRPDKKQVGVGTIVNGQGIPLVSQTLDGNKADCEWNKEAIGVLQEVLGDRLSNAVYIADCKLITMPNIHLLCNENKPVQFISRCPDAFYGKLTNQLVEQAYQLDNWSKPLSMGKSESYTQYRVQSFVRKVEGKELRFIVVETTSRKEALDRILEREKTNLEKAVKSLLQQVFACEADAKAALALFERKNKKNLWLFKGAVYSQTHTKYKRGRRAPGQLAQVDTITTTWHIKENGFEQQQENVEKKVRQLATFVLISNVAVDKMDDQAILFHYKGQAVVEVQFHLLKTPCLASQVFLKKPERIAALMMLLHVALLIRALLQYHARIRVQELDEIPRIGLNRQRYERPTVENILSLLRPFLIINDGINRYHMRYDSFEEKRLSIMLYLLDVEESALFE